MTDDTFSNQKRLPDPKKCRARCDLAIAKFSKAIWLKPD
jgi:hypothetical protein